MPEALRGEAVRGGPDSGVGAAPGGGGADAAAFADAFGTGFFRAAVVGRAGCLGRAVRAPVGEGAEDV